MVLPRFKQEIQKCYSQLGITEHESIKYLLDLCKGRKFDNKSKWFYYLFLSRTDYGAPDNIEEVRNKLKSAYWVEEEDIIQEILIYIYYLKLKSNDNILRPLSRNLRDYLIYNERVFSRQENWQDSYKEILILEKNKDKNLNIDLNNVIKNKENINFDIIDRYIMYLICYMGMNRHDISKILNFKVKRVDKLLGKFKQKIKENK